MPTYLVVKDVILVIDLQELECTARAEAALLGFPVVDVALVLRSLAHGAAVRVTR